MGMHDRSGSADIAIVGMAAHLPGAASIAEYWDNLRGGVESIRPLTEAELREAGESPSRMRQPNYVPFAATLDRFDHFDAEFFGLSPKEAAIMDPQHRQFLETAWEAMENAGHTPEGLGRPIGVFAGCGMGSYFYFNVCSQDELVRSTGMFLLRHTGNDKDFLSTRVSHILDLTGPSISVQTACSTSLVAIHMACQSIQRGECAMALAGGVTIELPHGRGYLYQDGEVLSPDGHCHAFDHRGQGTVFGSGAGCLVLRPLADALAEGDHVWAVIRGSAINNDGAAKAGYLAPSVDGQAAAVAAAHRAAGVGADSIGYIECHGTGTYLGDPIEIAALTEAFAETGTDAARCLVGSVKTNIGHLDTAAGVASVIKASLALHHREIPPSLGYEAPNPSIDFEHSPFAVCDRLTAFPQQGDSPRRAGVNSLGVGGTNAHVVLEEAPARAPSEEPDFPFQPLVVSARNKAALDQATARLAAHLRAHPEQKLADVAFTLMQGRRQFDHRRIVVASDHETAAARLESGDQRQVFSHQHLGDRPEVVFMFPGGGAQYAQMARGLYDTEPEFREWMDKGLSHLAPMLDYDPRAVWLPEPGQEAAAEAALTRPSVQLPLIAITEYALAKLWMGWGVQPSALIGHSMGENVAACIAGVMSFEDCIGLVHRRGQLFDSVPPGGMLSVPLSVDAVRPYLSDDLDIASVNAPELCVISGPDAALDALAARLAADEFTPQRIRIDIAAHSRMLEPILADFGAHLRGMKLSAPRLPVISNRSGEELTAAQATDPDYWVAHLRNTVHFADGMAHLSREKGRVYLEVGPGRTLASLAVANGVPANQSLATLRHPDHQVADDEWFIATLTRLWALGVAVDWPQFWGDVPRQRVVLPTYPFQRQRYFIDRAAAVARDDSARFPEREDDVAAWGWEPFWLRRSAEIAVDALDRAEPRCWLFLSDGQGLGAAVAAPLRAAGHRVIEVLAGDSFARLDPDRYCISPERGREDYDLLLGDLVAQGLAPDRIAHFWLAGDEGFRPGSSLFHRNLEQGFYSLTFLAQAMDEAGLPAPWHLTAITRGAAALPLRGGVGGAAGASGGDISGQKIEPLAHPEKAAIAGPLGVIPRDFAGASCSSLDIDAAAPLADTAAEVLAELLAPPGRRTAALRAGVRYARDWRPRVLPAADGAALPQGAVCLITGAFGGIGLTVARRLWRDHGARLVLLGRSVLPDRGDWPALIRQAPPGDRLAARLRAVEALEAEGAEVLTLAADICNVEEVEAARAAAEARFGRIDAVIHAAGVVDDAPILTKTPESIEQVLAPKLHGTMVLDSAFPDGSVGLIVVFSSSSTVTTPPGQLDYVAANSFLNAWAESRAGGLTRVLAINWGIWADVGMAAAALAPPAPAAPTPIAQPLLSEAGFGPEGQRLFAGVVDHGDWIIDGHRLASGQALLPGTGYLELLAEALAEVEAQGPLRITDLTFLRPLLVAEGEQARIRVRLARTPSGYDAEIRSAVAVDGSTGWLLHAEARVETAAAAPPMLDIAAIRARCPQPEQGEGLVTDQERHLRFGQRWRVLQTRALGEGEGIADLALPAQFRGADAGYLLHPALLDIATGWAMRLIEGYDPSRLWVPLGYGAITLTGPLPAQLVSHIRNAAPNRDGDGLARFDITLADEGGRVVAEIAGFTLRRIEGALDLSAAPDAREIAFDAADAPRQIGPAEEQLRHNLSQGIHADEGAEAFLRAIASGAGQLVVSSIPLPALIAQADAGAEAGQPGATEFERPELDSEFIAPRNDIERTLVGFWKDLLGVGNLGVEDSFFDLGGHSLIAVRLFSMIRKTYSVDFPISILFEAPTIAACAALIEAQIGPAGDTAEPAPDSAPAEVAPMRRHTHLVAMHRGDGGPRTPFFLVAGMFGNVLNLRHLAQLLGNERPFYGLQARGLFGDAPPHEDFTDAARDYIVEMRQVQPQGPYLVGGFSGGGLIAWEIARQLEEAGETVAVTVLLDTPLPMRPVPGRVDKALIKLAMLREEGPAYLSRWAREKAEWKRAQRNSRAVEDAHQLHNSAIEAAFYAALPRFDMVRRDGRVVLLRPALDRRFKVSGGRWISAGMEYVMKDNGLTPLAPALEVIEVPGDHDSMVLEPNVRVLASHLRRILTQAESAPARQAAE